MKVSWDYSPQYMENKKCSKPPTRYICIYIYNYIYSSVHSFGIFPGRDGHFERRNHPFAIADMSVISPIFTVYLKAPKKGSCLSVRSILRQHLRSVRSERLPNTNSKDPGNYRTLHTYFNGRSPGS